MDKSIKAGGLTLHIEQDDYWFNPREENENIGHWLCWHRRYNLGDKNPYKEPDDFHEDKELQDDIFVIRKVYMLDHSGLAFSTSRDSFAAVDPYGFDWGTIGVIYATKTEVLKKYGDLSDETKAKVDQRLVDEIKAYDDAQNREYYYFCITDGEGNTIDSCGGFSGDSMKDVLNNMKENVGNEYHLLFDKMQEHLENRRGMY